MVISGNNFQDSQDRTNYSYYFSRYNHCWGWATWKRAWQYWNFTSGKWLEFKNSGLMEQSFDDIYEQKYWTKIFDQVFLQGKPDSWAYVWTFACWSQGGLTILPSQNLVSNIGFGEDSTHTKSKNSPFANLPTMDIWEIKHPPFMVRHQEADTYTFDYHFGGVNMKKTKTFKDKLSYFVSNNKRRVTHLITDPISFYTSVRRKFRS